MANIGALKDTVTFSEKPSFRLWVYPDRKQWTAVAINTKCAEIDFSDGKHNVEVVSDDAGSCKLMAKRNIEKYDPICLFADVFAEKPPVND
jgi:hypothetical protein